LVVVLAVFTGNAAAQSGDVAIVNVTVIDPAAGAPQSNMTVILRGAEIVAVSRAKDTKVPAGTQTVDGTGKYLIPAFWDMHVHFRDADSDLIMYVANGVLGIRDMGGAAKDVYPLREAIANGERLGPKIVASGAIVWMGPTRFQILRSRFLSCRPRKRAKRCVLTRKRERTS
jgi:imidazolonepropionase-like amidohydrolase